MGRGFYDFWYVIEIYNLDALQFTQDFYHNLFSRIAIAEGNKSSYFSN